jgi:hypothetical protein
MDENSGGENMSRIKNEIEYEINQYFQSRNKMRRIENACL